MDILYLEWNSYANKNIKQAFKNLGHFLHIIPFDTSKNCKNDTETCEQLVHAILSNHYDFVFSINYFPVAAIACKACGIKYISWTYDNPYTYLYSDTVFFETNYVFVFDSKEVEALKGLGVKNVFYLPMAVPANGYSNIIPTKSDLNKYSCDISMIGSMYSEKKHNLIDKLSNISNHTKGYLDAIMQAQKFLYGINVIDTAITKEITNELEKYAPLLAPEDELQTKSWVYSRYFFLRNVTKMERFEIINAISKLHDTHLYTHEPTPHIICAKNLGGLDYDVEMIKAMKCSKINLNISLRSIQSGIPLRCFDVMGAGGLLFTNFQEDLMEYFIPDEDLIIYESLDDLLDKVAFYLSQSDLSKKISINGFEKVTKYHTYETRINSILEITQAN